MRKRSDQPRPPAAALGVHRLSGLLLALQGLVLLASAPFYGRFGLTIDWRTFVPGLLMLGIAFAVWIAHLRSPGRPSDWHIAESLVVFMLLATCALVIPPAQYLAVALGRPLADGWLARADALLGFSVPDLVRWTGGHPLLTALLLASYGTLLPQLLLPVIVLGPRFQNRKALWEYAFHVHVCLICTLVGLALFPAVCAFTYYGFESLIDQSRFIHDFDALRAGSFRELRLNELEGLISFPSFHVAGALIVTWAFREHRRIFLVLAALNTLLIASTVMLGAHYVVDIFATFVLFAVSVGVYRAWGRHLIEPGTHSIELRAPAAVPVAVDAISSTRQT